MFDYKDNYFNSIQFYSDSAKSQQQAIYTVRLTLK